MLQSYHLELATVLLNYHIGRIVLGSMCVGVSVWLGWSGIRVAGLSSGACDFSVELPHWSYCSWFDVCWSFGVVGLELYLCCRLKHKLYDIGCIVLGSMCVRVSVYWVGVVTVL